MTRTDELLAKASRRRPEHDAGSARELLAGSIGEDPYRQIEDLREAGRRKAKAEAVAYRLERERKSLLARLQSEYSRAHSDEPMSEAKLERLARADDRYQKHIEGTAAAIEERELAQSEYWALRTRLEWDRASVAHLNAMSKLEEPA